MNDIVFYCLNYNNEERKQNMIRRFESLNINYSLYNGVSTNDERIQRLENKNKNLKALSCMYGHLDMIKQFYDSEKEYAIFCEDDIYIHKHLPILLNTITADFKKYNFGVLLLGYLSSYKITRSNLFSVVREQSLKHLEETKKISDDSFGENSNVVEKLEYYTYPDDLWGTQMYMFSRTHAKNILDTYYNIKNTDSIKTHFSSDWILTKEGNRALITPIMCIEDNSSIVEHYGQRTFHEDCFKAHFDAELFLK